jgi:hypothetical protein
MQKANNGLATQRSLINSAVNSQSRARCCVTVILFWGCIDCYLSTWIARSPTVELRARVGCRSSRTRWGRSIWSWRGRDRGQPTVQQNRTLYARSGDCTGVAQR